jgi:hypothetical protein
MKIKYTIDEKKRIHDEYFAFLNALNNSLKVKTSKVNY